MTTMADEPILIVDKVHFRGRCATLTSIRQLRLLSALIAAGVFVPISSKDLVVAVYDRLPLANARRQMAIRALWQQVRRTQHCLDRGRVELLLDRRDGCISLVPIPQATPVCARVG